jgi:NAD+ synthase
MKTVANMPLTIALVQTNFTVGYIEGNIIRIKGLHSIAATANADLVVFSEMAVTGYPPEDLVLRKHFQKSAMKAIAELALITKDAPAIIIGGLWLEDDLLYNTVFLLSDGKIAHLQYKCHLPNYGVFDEKRVFIQGTLPKPCEWNGIKLGLLICEDMWQEDVATHLKNNGGELLISINASPYEIGKANARMQVAKARVQETALPLVYVNQIGGQDELVFDGQSFVLSAEGELSARLHSFQEDMAFVNFDKEEAYTPQKALIQPIYSNEETIYRAMAVGLQDYVEKNSFKGVVLGMSGGIDSAISAAVATDALGHERVRLIMMPSPYTSHESIEDATECAKLLNLRLDTVNIEPGMKAFEAMLDKSFDKPLHPITLENIQPRLRGATLMAISNNEDLLLLTTGNKSEMSVGYATLYGDMCGGYNVLKDIYKTTVYKVAVWRNSVGRVIPERILTKAPSAELKPNQTDQDSLPPYDILDAILLRLVELQLSTDEIIAQGYASETVKKVAKLLYQAEYKRRQAPPGVKITGMSFGRDRRYPITNGWKG